MLTRWIREQREKGAAFGRLNELVKTMFELWTEPAEVRQLALQFCKLYRLTIKQIDVINVFSCRA